jgi:hypothetical protein
MPHCLTPSLTCRRYEAIGGRARETGAPAATEIAFVAYLPTWVIQYSAVAGDGFPKRALTA